MSTFWLTYTMPESDAQSAVPIIYFEGRWEFADGPYDIFDWFYEREVGDADEGDMPQYDRWGAAFFDALVKFVPAEDLPADGAAFTVDCEGLRLTFTAADLDNFGNPTTR